MTDAADADIGSTPDTAGETATDATDDAATEAGGETAEDTTGETGTDATGETTTEATGETATEVGGETATEAGGETATEASGETATDAVGGSTTDATGKTAADASTGAAADNATGESTVGEGLSAADETGGSETSGIEDMEEDAAESTSKIQWDYLDSIDDLDTGHDRAVGGMSLATYGIALASTSAYGWDYEIYYVGESDKYYVEETGDYSLKYQMVLNVSTDIEAGAVEILIPAALYIYRDGTNVMPSDIGVPYGEPGDYTESSVTVMNYYYKTIDGVEYLVFWNYADIDSGTDIAWQVLYRDVSAMDTIDMTDWSLDSTATVTKEVDGETVTQTEDGETLSGLVDTYAQIDSVTKSEYKAYPTQTYPSSLYTQAQLYSQISQWTDEGTNIYDNYFDDYVYQIWTVTVSGSGNQPYDLSILDTPSDDGVVMGYYVEVTKSTGTFDSTLGTDDDGYTQVADDAALSSWTVTFHVVTAYPRSILPESDDEDDKYYESYEIGPADVENTISVKLTPSDEVDAVEYASDDADSTYGENIEIDVVKSGTEIANKSYGPGLYTEKQVEKYVTDYVLDDSTVSQIFEDIDNYRFVLWTVKITIESAEDYVLSIKDTPGETGGGTILGYGANGSEILSFDGDADEDGMLVIISNGDGTTGKTLIEFYVVTVYELDNLTEGAELQNTIYAELTDSLGYTVWDEDDEEWPYGEYLWVCHDVTEITKTQNVTYAAGLMDFQGEANTYTFPFTTKASIIGYSYTHYNTSAAASAKGKRIWDYMEGSYYTVTVDDSTMVFSTDSGDSCTLGSDDYYFTSVAVTRSEYDWDVWEDEKVDEAAHPNDDLDESIYIYVKCAHPELVSSLASAGDGWYLIATVDFTGSSASYTFTDEELACEPYCVKAVYNTTNYNSTCTINVEVKIRDGADTAVYQALHDENGNWKGVDFGYLKDTSNVTAVAYDAEGNSSDKIDEDVSATKTLWGLDELSGGYKTVSITNDPVNGQVEAVYNIAAFNGYYIPTTFISSPIYYLYGQNLVNYMQANDLDFPASKDVVFYDLLPLGVEFDASIEPTVGRLTNFSEAGKPTTWDRSDQVELSDWTVEYNWQDTGRTMLTFYVSYTGADPSAYYYNSAFNYYWGVWGEGYGVQFNAYYVWDDIDMAQNENNPNIVAYMQGDDAAVDGLLGTEYTDMSDDVPETDNGAYSIFAGKDINGNGTADDVVYATTTIGSDVAIATQGQIEKLARADANATDSYTQKAAVAAGENYTYQITVSTTEDLKNLVVFDRIEDGVKDHVASENDGSILSESWQGTFLGVDTSGLTLSGVAPVVYYCTSWNCTLPDTSSGSVDMDAILEEDGWVRADEYNGKLSDVKAFAVDCRKDIYGEDFVLEAASSVSFVVHMQAPELDEVGNAIYAYNNAYFYSVAVSTQNEALEQSETARVAIGSPNTFILEKETAGDVPTAWADTEFEFHLTTFTDPDDPESEREDFGNRIYSLWEENDGEWTQIMGTYSTDSHGYVYLLAGQKAVFEDMTSAEIDSLVAEETASIFWDTDMEISTETTDIGTSIINCVVTNTYRTPMYVTKAVSAVPDDVDISDELFTFQVFLKDEEGEYQPYANAEYWLVSSARINGTTPDKLNDEELTTDDDGCFTLHAGETAALLFDAAGLGVKVVETDTGENFITDDTGQTGTTAAKGVAFTITNIYRWKDLMITKELTHQDPEDCEMEFTFEVLHVVDGETTEPVVGNVWTMVDADGVAVKDADGNPIGGTLDEDGCFTAACAGNTVIVKGLDAGESYVVHEVGELGDYYEDVTGEVSATMPIYSTSASVTYTNDYLMRSLSVTKLVASDDADYGDAEFTFTLYMEGEDGEYEVAADAAYVIKENGETGEVQHTNSEGEFILKSGQIAIFNDIGLTGTAYKVEESGNETSYRQIYPANEEPVTGIFYGETNMATFINGSEGFMTLSKNYNCDMDDASAVAYIYGAYGMQADLGAATRESAAVTFHMEVGGETWPVEDVDVDLVDTLGLLEDETVTWKAGEGITVMPWQTIILSPEVMAKGAGDEETYDEDDLTNYSYEIWEETTHWLVQQKKGVWLFIRQTDPEDEASSTGGVLTAPAVTVTNTVMSFKLDGSSIYKHMSVGSSEVATGRKLVWTLQRYEGGSWVPAEGVAYLTFDDEGPTCDEILYTGSDGTITLTKTENGYPYVSFLDETVYINYYEGMEEGDLRLIEDEVASDAGWGYLAGYDDSAVGYGYSLSCGAKTTVENEDGEEEVVQNAIAFVNSNYQSFFKVVKTVDTDSGQTFTFRLEQVMSVYGDDAGELSGSVAYSEAVSGVAYTIYDFEGNIVGTGTTDANGYFYLTGGQYAIFQVENGSEWTVSEISQAGWTLDSIDGTEGDTEVVSDHAAELTPQADFKSLITASYRYEDGYLTWGDSLSGSDFEVWYYDSTGTKRELESTEFTISPDKVTEGEVDVDDNNNLTITITYHDDVAGKDLTDSFVMPVQVVVAIYSATDKSLVFKAYNSSEEVPQVDDTYTDENGTERTVTAVYTGVDRNTYGSYSSLPWYSKYRTSITSVEITDWFCPRSASYLFSYLTNCTSMDLRGLDTSCVTNMKGMFYYNQNLTNIEGMDGWDVSNVTNMSYMFYYCQKLTDISDLEDWDTSSVTDMSYMFYYCSALTDISALRDWETSSVTNMSRMFYYCNTLTDITALTDWDISNVENLSGMFYYCSKLSDITPLANWDTSSVTDMSYLFTRCTSLSDISILANWDTSNVENMSYMFDYCTSLSDLSPITEWDTSNVKDMSYMFYNCTALSDLSPITEWDTSNVTNMSYMFYDCTKLSDLSPIAEWDTSNVTDMTDMFGYCTSLSDLSPIAEWDTSNVESMASMFYHCTSLSDLSPIAEWDTSNVENMSSMFYYCTSLTDLSPLSEWDTSAVTNMSSMFRECNKLTTLDGLEDWDVSAVQEMYYMFCGCTSLDDLTALADWDTSAVKDMYYMFYGCKNLEDITALADWDTSAVNNMYYMFYNCSSLTTLEGLEDWDVSNVTYMYEMFYGCSGLTTLAALSKWSTGKVTSMYYMFYGCSGLTDLTGLEDWDVSTVQYMYGMFYGCSGLTTLEALSGWTTSKLTQMYYMFRDCSSLTDLKGLESWDVSGVTAYMYGLFYGCSGLTDVSIFAGWTTSQVTDMNSMFYGCTGLTSLKTLSSLKTDAVTNMNSMFYGCTGLTDITDISGWDTSKVTNMSYMFRSCTGVSDFSVLVTLDTSSVTNMSYLFYGCTSLTDLTKIADMDISSVTSMNYMFYGCTGLTGLGGLDSWDISTVTSISYMFENCSNLSDITALSNWTTSAVTTVAYMFYGCTSLVDASALNGWDLSKVTSMSYMFYGCTALTTLDVSSWGVAKISSMSYAFRNCSSLQTLDMSSWDTSSLSNLYYAFYGCSNLSGNITITSNITSSTSYNYAFQGCSTASGATFTINWKSGYSDTATRLYNTKSNTSNVVLGSQVD